MTIWINVHENGEYKALCAADSCRHYKPPTVEDVLREMLEQAVGYSDAHTTVALNTISEYATKLQLRGDGE